MVMGARVSHPPITHAMILPVSGSFSLQIFRLNGPAAMCHCVWNQQMRSGMEMMDCEKAQGFGAAGFVERKARPVVGVRTRAALHASS